MLTPDKVTAVLVTRGDVDLTPVLDSLIFDDVVVWDNSVESEQMTYGRVLVLGRGQHEIIYSQDDDIIHSPENQLRILSEYEPGVLTGCMWKEWSDGARAQGIEGGYDDLVFMGSGSVFDRGLPSLCVSDYLDLYTFDDFFRLWCDTIVGVIAPTKQIDLRFEELPHAANRNRMSWLEDAVTLKTEAIRRAREVRDRAGVLA